MNLLQMRAGINEGNRTGNRIIAVYWNNSICDIVKDGKIDYNDFVCWITMIILGESCE